MLNTEQDRSRKVHLDDQQGLIVETLLTRVRDIGDTNPGIRHPDRCHRHRKPADEREGIPIGSIPLDEMCKIHPKTADNFPYFFPV